MQAPTQSASVETSRSIPSRAYALALAVERLVIAELGVQDHRQQVRSCATPGDRMERRGRLGDRLAGTAGKLLTHRLDHLPLTRHALQGLGDRLAQLGQGPATAGACGRAGDDDTLARQVCRQRARTGLRRVKGCTVLPAGATAIRCRVHDDDYGGRSHPDRRAAGSGLASTSRPKL